MMFDIKNIIVEIWGYPLSYAELLGTLSGLLSVYWASKTNILTWPAGIVNELFLFVVFFQVQLYANMFLQAIFFGTTLYGWYRWRKPDGNKHITRMKPSAIFAVSAMILAGTILTGWLVSRIHICLPEYFAIAAPYPYTDSLVMVMSVAATILLARKKVENWVLWIMVDVVSVVLYALQGIWFIALEYLVLLGMASFGLYHWRKQLKTRDRLR